MSRRGLRIAQHAIERCIERVAGCSTEEQARAVLSSRAVNQAHDFGAHYVRLGTGQHVVIRDGTVITVLPKEAPLWRLQYFSREFV